ncbi:MAG: peptidoglycan editing factor PgeF [Acidobacteriota bacterium]|nr:peptidoglycan editing factor PgeF [Acidobacteriota bacterium]
MIQAPNFIDLPWLQHGFGLRDSVLPGHIRILKQIHSAIVLNAGADTAANGAQEGDALSSDRAGVLVGVKTADCVPILLAEPSIPLVIAVHAGWRGTAENIVSAAVNELVASWRIRPENVRAAIGPSIGVCCYEVGPEVARHFGAWNPELAGAGGPVRLDLPAINRQQLEETGVENIWTSGECTFCNADKFFSWRRDRERAGRMVSFIGLPKNIGRTSVGPPGKP